MRKTKEEAAVTREKLMNSALSVFSRKGYASTTLEDVAHEVGVTRGAVYWHFGSKAELYNELMAEFSARASSIVQNAAAEGGSLTDILRRVFIRLLEAVENDPTLREIMEINLFKTERSTELLTGQQQRLEGSRSLMASIAAVMAKGAASGELRGDLDPLDMARAFLAMNNGAIYLWLSDPTAFALRTSAPSLADIYLQGILPRVLQGPS